MADYTNNQKRIIERYYDQRDAIMLTRLQELVTELYLAETDKKRAQLWKRVDTAMTHLKVSPSIKDHILASADPAILAQNVKDWVDRGQAPH